VEGEFVKNIPIILPSSSGAFDVLQIKQCVEPFDDISIIIDSNNPTIGGDPVFIDFVNLFDADGQIACAPNLGVDDFSYNYTEPKPYIPIGQGFFVEGDANDGGTIVFNNSQREYKKEGSESVFFKTSSKKPHANSISNTSVIKLGMDFNDSDSGEKAMWDELVVNNFKIQKIHVAGGGLGPDYHDDEVRDRHSKILSELGFPFELYEDVGDLVDYITRTVSRIKL
jgi:hypothetical protein